MDGGEWKRMRAVGGSAMRDVCKQMSYCAPAIVAHDEIGYAELKVRFYSPPSTAFIRFHSPPSTAFQRKKFVSFVKFVVKKIIPRSKNSFVVQNSFVVVDEKAPEVVGTFGASLYAV